MKFETKSTSDPSLAAAPLLGETGTLVEKVEQPTDLEIVKVVSRNVFQRLGQSIKAFYAEWSGCNPHILANDFGLSYPANLFKSLKKLHHADGSVIHNWCDVMCSPNDPSSATARKDGLK